MRDDLAAAYESRRSLLDHVAHSLECEVREYLSLMNGVGHITFSVRSTVSFIEAARVREAAGDASDPLVELEDQISGNVAVATEQNLVDIEKRLKQVLSAVEGNWRETTRSTNGGLPIRCLICVIPPQVKPPGWDSRDDVPKTFEIRLNISPEVCLTTTEGIDTLPIHGENNLAESEPLPIAGRVLFGLHGIRTHAGWCRAFYEVASDSSWQVRMDRWNFGYFNIILFLLTFARAAKIRWFRKVYREECQDKDVRLDKGQYPSIVAHSFGTYILGNALLKYDWLHFDKVILCGSILPQDFPWDELIERGQVQAVRNEYGTNDVPTRLVKWFVAGTGPSGRRGFSRSHERFEQEQFEYTHSEYFDKGHMEAKWLPFLGRQLPFIDVSAKHVKRPKANRPWGLYAGYLLLIIGAFLLAQWLGFFNKLGISMPRFLQWTHVSNHWTGNETAPVIFAGPHDTRSTTLGEKEYFNDRST